MRVLLVDNHDSFTYNLAHALAVLTADWPEVVRNDDPAAAYGDSGWLGQYDAVVLSPGPGTPLRAADLGHSAAVVRQGRVPVLGICLGHQAIGAAYGARVGRAPEPVHGRTATVVHDGRGLFAGVPSPVELARYHSLIVDRLPPDLVADAWADDLVMAMHHVDRPLWGIQAHPESIASAYGDRILANFLDLARAWNSTERATGPASPPQPPPLPTARGGPAHSPRTVHSRRLPFMGSCENAFAELFLGDDHAWWLDSARPETDAGRFSYLGSAAGPLARVVRGRSARLLDVLARELEAPADGVDDVPFAFTLGWVGWLTYELGVGILLGEQPADETESVLVFADRCVVVDHERGEAWVLALQSGYVDQSVWIDETADRLHRLSHAAGHENRRPAPLPPAPVVEGIDWRHDRARYRTLIEECQQLIAAGESYELCLTNQAHVRTRSESWPLYRRLRSTSPRPFGAYLAFGETHLLSASPERLLRVDPHGQVEARPIKGTRPRGTTPDEDARLAAELGADVKERAENLMVVDVVRNDLGRVCAAGTVTVPRLFEVETHVGAHQLVSTVRGRLAVGRSALDALCAAVPPASMTGAPKERSVALLRHLEAGPRGVYSGAVGFLSLSGAADWSVVIRSVVWRPERLTYGAGGAITALSDPDAEWREVLVKARTLGAALDLDHEPTDLARDQGAQ